MSSTWTSEWKIQQLFFAINIFQVFLLSEPGSLPSSNFLVIQTPGDPLVQALLPPGVGGSGGGSNAYTAASGVTSPTSGSQPPPFGPAGGSSHRGSTVVSPTLFHNCHLWIYIPAGATNLCRLAICCPPCDACTIKVLTMRENCCSKKLLFHCVRGGKQFTKLMIKSTIFSIYAYLYRD